LIYLKRENAKHFSTIPGVTNTILITGKTQMLVLIELTPTAKIPLHSHMNEQVGICLEGTVEFLTEDGPVVIEENMSYVFQRHEKHGCRPLSKEGVTLLESFSPPRADFLALVQ
jgi:quercetin dioxygenase-like cupin family protein